MVIQRGAPITIWGFSAPSSPVYAVLTDLVGNSTFNASGTATPDGVWAVAFPPQAGGWDWRLSVSDSPEAVACALYPFYCEGAFAEISGIVIGDVVACVRVPTPARPGSSSARPSPPPPEHGPNLNPRNARAAGGAEQHAGECGLCL